MNRSIIAVLLVVGLTGCLGGPPRHNLKRPDFSKPRPERDVDTVSTSTAPITSAKPPCCCK